MSAKRQMDCELVMCAVHRLEDAAQRFASSTTGGGLDTKLKLAAAAEDFVNTIDRLRNRKAKKSGTE